MFSISIIRPDVTIVYAAEELKKYLRMMMPEAGDIAIHFGPGGDGFRLGLMSDFDLAMPEVEDPVLDDLVYIDTTADGGILAGSNPRSVLFAVYRYLKENGCRWLFPGPDGECIPIADVKPISYRHLAAHRFRGWCNEGAESQECMLETIEFAPKLEMNVYMIEFDTPYAYYINYYYHHCNRKNRSPQLLSHTQVKQWKRQCEAEIARRGLQFHDMGHGWTADPFGLNSGGGWERSKEPLPDEKRKYVAQLNGEREFFGGVPMNTNICMSNPEARHIMAKAIADYAENHQNVDYLHVWLADGSRNHCECEECQKKRPSDFYMMIMNELDALLTARGLDTRIVFIAYIDTLYAPREIQIQNPKRFALLYAPIQRSYHSSLDATKITDPPEYIRNTWPTPVSSEENAAFLVDWQKDWKGPCFCYEYHFWVHMARDPGAMIWSRRIYEDVRALHSVGLQGIVQDGSQRCFYPSGLGLYVYAAALLDDALTYEEIKDDYFRHLYGDLAPKAEEYLTKISDAFAFGAGEGEEAANRLRGVHAITEEYHPFVMDNLQRPTRAQSIGMYLLSFFKEYCDLLSDLQIEKYLGNKEEAKRKYEILESQFGRHEVEMDRYFDQSLIMSNHLRH